jgi:sarcosine oxidase subunit delta
MQRFDCPFCGPRDHSEFTYGREVAPIPALDAPAEEWQRHVFLRDNPCGAHAEWWHHNLGCRQWLVITRDTSTHVVIGIAAARDAQPGATATASAAVDATADPTRSPPR